MKWIDISINTTCPKCDKKIKADYRYGFDETENEINKIIKQSFTCSISCPVCGKTIDITMEV